ncbi:MAG: amino acid permease [Pseudomonadota bacterium]
MSDNPVLLIPDPVVAEDVKLRRALGPVHLTMIGVGATIGAGIFVIAGTVSAQHAGPAVLLSFLIAATGCFFAALCYAELAAMIPQAGSAYTYTYATMGRTMAWFIGWNMVLEFGVSASTVAAGWSGYFLNLLHSFGVNYPAAWANAPIAGTGISDMHLTGAIVNLPAGLIMLAITAILVIGISESARFNAAMVVLKVAIITAVIAFGLPYVQASNLHPFIPPNTGVWGHFGASGVLAASGTVFFAYVGFETVSVAAQETRNPERDVSISILAALAVCTLLYVLMSIVLIGIIDYHLLDVPDPVSFALERHPDLKWLVFPVNIAAIAGLISVAFGSLYGQSRVFYGMARDGFLPPVFAKVHPRFRTPALCTIITGVVGAVIAAIFPLDLLADLVSIGTLLAFISVCVGILILRKTAPNIRRKFRTPWVGFVAPAGIITCGVMMFSLSNGTWWRLVVWTAIGFIIYFAYGIRHAAPSKWSVSDES